MSKIYDVLLYDTIGIIAIITKPYDNTVNQHYFNLTNYVVYLYDFDLNSICDAIDSHDYYYKELKKRDAFKLRLNSTKKSLHNADIFAQILISFGYDTAGMGNDTRRYINLRDPRVNINNIFAVKIANINNIIIFNDEVIIKYNSYTPIIAILILMLTNEYFIPTELQDIIINLLIDSSCEITHYEYSLFTGVLLQKHLLQRCFIAK